MCQPMVAFQHQDPSSSLCAYFSLHHFLRGQLCEKSFLSQAAQFYKSELQLPFDEAKVFASAGNDPAVVARILKGQAAEKIFLTDGDVRFYNKILIALKNRAHFITILKCPCKASWWNYDSLLVAPERIANVKQFIQANQGRQYYVSL